MDILGCQLNFNIGDFEGNANKIIEKINEYGDNYDLLVFSELCVSGYPPHDLMYEPDFIFQQNKAIKKIRESTKGKKAGVVIGYVGEGNYKPFTNSLLLIHDNCIKFNYNKMLLPDYDIFDEYRHFDVGKKPGLFKFKGEIILFAICEDLWFDNSKCYEDDPFRDVVCNLIISINASPSLLNKVQKRINICKKLSEKKQCDVLYVNQVGGYDDVIFDGGSFFISSVTGDVYTTINQFEEGTISNLRCYSKKFLEGQELIYKQLVFGIKEYCKKCGFKKVVVGSSGGIDSALVLALAVEALGPENVEAITMPSEYSSTGSYIDSESLCRNLDIKLKYAQIKDIHKELKLSFKHDIKDELCGLADENTQARIRGTILMAYSNKTGAMVLSTGNKSEMSVGYCTLYGDMNGGLSPISDLYKTEVFELAKWINRDKEIIPWTIINKAPSAELSPNQKDTDSLPPYEVLDEILKYLIEGNTIYLSNVITVITVELVNKIHKMVLRNEFKRRQSAPTIKIHNKSYGYGRRIPLAQSYLIE